MSSNEIQIPQAKDILVDTTGAVIVAEDSPATRDSRGIYLPHYIEPVSHIAIDIGGSLAKVVYFTRSPNPPNGHSHVGVVIPATSGSGQGTSGTVPVGGGSNGSGNGIAVGEGSIGTNGDPWYPVLNGALTPELLAKEQLPLSSHNPASSSSETPASPPPTHTRSASRDLPNDPTKRQKRGESSIRKTAVSQKMIRRGSLPPNFPGGTLNFVRFETERIDEMLAFLKELIATSAATNHVSEERMKKGVKILATGGGAHKYYDALVEGLGVEVTRQEEMECLIIGLSFITCIPDEVFWYSDELVNLISHAKEAGTAEPTIDTSAPSNRPDPSRTPSPDPSRDRNLPRPSPDPPSYQVTFDTSGTPQFPCLLVNIGSGVSVVKVDEDGSFERVSGTSVGGGTLWGLLSLLTDAENFDEMLALSDKGDNSLVDMLVGDIYGSDYTKVGLKASTIASSFGKVFKKGNGSSAAERKKKFRQEDIAKSLLYAVSNNIGQIAYMNAEKYGLDRIYFGGCFIRGHASTISTLSYAIRFWSRGTVKAMFLRHEGFLGSVGAWIKSVNVQQGGKEEEPSKPDVAA